MILGSQVFSLVVVVPRVLIKYILREFSLLNNWRIFYSYKLFNIIK